MNTANDQDRAAGAHAGPPNFDRPHSDADRAQDGSGTAGDAEAGGPDELMHVASERIRTLESSVEEMREKWLRAEAEIQNVRTRAKRDVDDARQYAVQKFAKDVVEAAENLRRGLSSLPPADADENPVVTKLREGFESVERSFLGILERNGITGTDPTGSSFDANLHQAMAEQPSGDHPPGTVLQAWTSAWTLHGRLLKPAMVVVSKSSEPAVLATSQHEAEAGAQVGGPSAQAPAGGGFDRTV
ncbi:nucleotide exchange factor GrpE [Lichenicola sp.]|uniref:nucleotide exchange factor GrpE n=1 Tax=Lichenicola sp. TaxID=2804529 RepID=UPI003AFFFEDE